MYIWVVMALSFRIFYSSNVLTSESRLYILNGIFLQYFLIISLQRGYVREFFSVFEIIAMVFVIIAHFNYSMTGRGGGGFASLRASRTDPAVSLYCNSAPRAHHTTINYIKRRVFNLRFFWYLIII